MVKITRFSFIASVLSIVLVGCGSQPEAPPTAEPASQPSTQPASQPAEAANSAPADTQAPWSDVHELHEKMEANGEMMGELKSALKKKDYPTAREEAAQLVASFVDLEKRAESFAGPTPEQFRAFASDAVKSMGEVHAILEDGSDTAMTSVPDAMAKLVASCKACHKIYREED